MTDARMGRPQLSAGRLPNDAGAACAAPGLAGQRDAARWQAMVDVLPNMVFEADARGRNSWSSAAWMRYTGLTVQELANDGWQRVIHPQDLTASHDAWLQGLATGADFSSRRRIRRHDGQWRWHVVHVVPVRDAQGAIEAWVGSATDIDNEVRAQAAQAASEAHLRAVLDALPTGVVIADAQGALLHDNAAHRALWGLEPEAADWTQYGEWVGFWPDSGHRLRAEDWAMSRALLHGEVVRGELVECQPFDGGPRRFYLNNAAPVRDAGGTIVGGVVVELDVTEARQAQEQLRLSREMFATAFANNPAAIALTRLDDGSVLDVNETWLRMAGEEDRQAVIGRSARHMWPRLEDARHFLDELRDKGTLHDWEQAFLRRSGELFFTQISAQILTVRGEQVILSTLVDITKHKQAEAKLQALNATLEQRVRERTTELAAARDAAEAASRAKSAFLATMSHEFRTPLNAVIGLSQLLQQRALPQDVARFVGHIHDAGEQLLALVSDVLDLSRIEAGEMQLEEAVIEMAPLLDAVLAMVRPQADAKGLALVVDVPVQLPRRLLGDALRLRQVLLNLLGNAVKFTSTGSVTLRVLELAREAGTAALRFEVIDTGIGISGEAQQRIFEPFTQADSSTTRRFGGTGLGLSIVRRLVEMMSGRLELQSAPGQGSTFSVTLSLSLPRDPL